MSGNGRTRALFDAPFSETRIDVAGVRIHLRHGGSGAPLLLLHGYPQTHVIWHRVAPRLAMRFHVVCADLRGYGDSDKPASSEDHGEYSKRAMAADMVGVMTELGFDRFFVAGHDRGARVVHRMALDFPTRVEKACVMDIAPTHHMYTSTDLRFATAYYHWFFLIQPTPLPERLIGADPEFYLDRKLAAWSGRDASFDAAARAEYRRCFRNPATIHASCEDYRAAASIDLRHDEVDMHVKIAAPLLVLWGRQGFVHRAYDVLAVWRERARTVTGQALDCGHYLPEECPDRVVRALSEFLAD